MLVEAAAIFLLLFAAVTAELVAGGVGISLPATAAAVFYLGGVAGWRLALPLALAAGAWLDLLFGREWLFGPAGMALVVVVARIWPAGERALPWPAYLLPGALVGLAVTLVPGGARLLAAGQAGAGELLALAEQVLLGALLGAPLLPAAILALDPLAAACGLPGYRGRPGPVVGRRRDLVLDPPGPSRGGS